MRAACPALSFALAAALLAQGASASTRWHEAGRSDDPRNRYVLYQSDSSEDRYQSYKVETHFDAAPARAADALFESMTSSRSVPDGQRREVLSSGPDEVLVYTYIDLPMIMSDRDVAFRITRESDDASGVHRVSWEQANDAAPAPATRVVRMPEVSGYWEFRPTGAQRCSATYVTHADMGGAVPPWLIGPMMRGQVEGDVGRLRGLLREAASAVAAPPPSLGED